MSESVSQGVCVQGRGFKITVYNWTWGGLDTLGMNCTCEHTVHGVHTEHNVHTVHGVHNIHTVQRFTYVQMYRVAHMYRIC